jgi:hypothetical protein
MATDPVRPDGFTKADLRSIAVYQKVIIAFVGFYMLFGCGTVGLPQEIRAFLAIGLLLVGIMAAVCVFLLTIKLYQTVLGIVFGLLTIIPCVGLIMLLVINARATGRRVSEGSLAHASG